MEYKIQRFCWFDTLVKYTDAYPYGTIWKTLRAKDGMKLLVDQVICFTELKTADILHFFQTYEGE
ncbi:unnamed protein product, partial [marine sediment metagenome]